MSDSLNLLKRIKSGSYEVSLSTTFNLYFPFYEDVLLRRLSSAGCRANAVLADHRQLQQALSVPELRPVRAGYDYAIMGIRAAAAFHPKIMLLAGKRSGLAIVGSHNLTFSGFGHNREVSTLVSIGGKSDKEGVSFARQIWSFMDSWVDHEKDRLPSEVLESVRKTASTVSWLRGKADSSSNSVAFMGKRPTGPSLWSQLKPTLPEGIRRVTLVGPYFDNQLRLPLAVREDLGSCDVVIGVDPATVEINPDSYGNKELRFANARELGKSAGFLHGKIAYFEDERGDDTLVLGSANPSSPAWLEDDSRGNAEAVVVHRGRRAREIAEELGVSRLADAPDLEHEDWNKIRSRKPRTTVTDESTGNPYVVGVATTSGVEITDDRLVNTSVNRAFRVPADDQSKEPLGEINHSGKTLAVEVDSDALKTLRLMELVCDDGASLLCTVHHTTHLNALSQTGRQSQLRAALSALDGGGADIAGLVALCDKMIFSSDAQVDPPSLTGQSGSRTGSAADDSESKEEVVESLSASILESKKAQRRQRRLSREGDLGAILDFLVYRLGITPYSSTSGLDSLGRNEEERAGADDDQDDRIPIPMEMVESCQKKVKTLVTRMGKQLRAAPDSDQARALILVQLCAVLSVLRELRIVDRHADWVRPGQTLVPVSERRRLLEVSLGHLFGEEHQLHRKAIEDRDGEIFDEVSRLRGLLLWLAWDGGLRADASTKLSDSHDERRAKLLDRARIVILSRHASEDSVATEEASQSLSRAANEASQAAAARWLSGGIELGKAVNANLASRADPDGGPDAAPKLGDLVYVKNCSEPRVVVRDKQQKVFLADLDDGTQEKGFLVTHTRVALSLAD